MQLFELNNIEYIENDIDVGECIKATLKTTIGEINILEFVSDKNVSRIDSHIKYHEDLSLVFNEEELLKENIILKIHDQLQEYLDNI